MPRRCHRIRKNYCAIPNPNPSVQLLLRDIIGKLESGIDKFNEESIILYLTPPFRKMLRPPLARVSRGKVVNYVGRTSAADPGMEPYPYMY
jgi:hypothetical protein